MLSARKERKLWSFLIHLHLNKEIAKRKESMVSSRNWNEDKPVLHKLRMSFLSGRILMVVNILLHKPTHIISRSFNYAEQNGYPKICVRFVLGINGSGEGLVTLQLILSIRKGTSPFHFQSNEPFSKFLQRQMTILKFLSHAFRENKRCLCVCVCGGGYPPSDHFGN